MEYTNTTKYEMPLVIKPEHIDELKHVNNIVYLKWVQDLAVAHWQAAAPADVQKELVWVVVRHEIDYKRSALPGDEIFGRTWVGKASRRSFERFSEIIRKKDGKVLAAAKTFWCPIDVKTGRPTAVSEAIKEQFSTGEKE